MAEHQHHIVTERVTDAIVEVDADWRFTLVNERAEQIYETTEEELLGKYFWNVFTAGVDTVFEEEYRRVMETREPSSFEAQYDGSDDPSGLEGRFEVDVYPENDGGLAFYFRDITDRKRREEQAAGLNDVLAEFMDATSKQQVAEIVARAAEDRLHLPLTVIAVVDDASGELRPVAQSETAERGIDASSLFDQDGGIGWQVFINGEQEVIDSPPDELIDEQHSIEKLDIQPLSRHGVLVTGTRDPDDNFAETLAENLRTTLDRIHSDRLLQEREERLAEQNESLSRLNHINEIIRSIDQVLVSATSRREIQQAVCEELTTGDTYTFAWFGVHSTSSNRISPRNWAGEEKGYLEAVTFSAGRDRAAEPPVAEVVNTREPRVTNDVLQDPPFNRWQKAALNRGFRSNIALPILYKGSLYGVLDIHSHQPGVFNELEQNVLIELSQTIAYAINAVESKKALISDTVIDLALRLDPADHPLISFLQEGDDREFEFKGVVPTREGDFRVFYTVSGVSNETMMEFTDQATEVVGNELVSEHEEGLQYEVIVTEESLVHWVLNRGAVPQSISGDEIGGIVQVELYGYARLRDFVEQFQNEYPNSKLVASRERERPVHTRNEFLQSYENQLSERQREVLKMAYFSGYFESPRERNATDLATSMGITQPTFSTHLRAGLRNLFTLLFDKNGPD
jgi:PAS domain S-box-containing protein